MNCRVRVHPRCNGRAAHQHHRKLRSQGGTNDPDNLLGVCVLCHHEIHAHPAVSYEHGWLVKSWDDPATVPVQLACVVCDGFGCEFCPAVKEAA